MADSLPTPSITLRDRMMQIQQTRDTRLAIAIAPSLAKMPYPLQRHDDPFLPYSKAVIDATADLTAAYIFDLAAYLSVGASGAIALERAIAYVPDTCMTILHGTFADPNYADLLAPGAFHAEAATITVTLANRDEAVERFVRYGIGVFMFTVRGGAMPRSVYHDQIGMVLDSPAIDPLSPERVMAVSTQPPDPFILWGWYGDSVALAGRGEDYSDVIKQAAIARYDKLKREHDLFTGNAT